ncbi:hypothetical protein [Salegentibacter chungangensis]|uniref:Uncharacterized protein n=1 Tax=Salegentibacter chungangensis TaxID=1335724 RepID=A0ABW3NTF6_9FLAO
MKNIYLLTFLMFAYFNSAAQNSSCENFKTGNFIMPPEEGYSSVRIERHNNYQIEIPLNEKGLPDKNKEEQYINLEWVDDCTYIGKYDATKMELTEFQKFVNTNGGIKVEMKKIEKGCFFYLSTLTIEGEEQRLDGKMCLE